jgi:glutamate dehydrogenase (NADP+)
MTIATIIDHLNLQNPHEPEFHQAAREVLNSLEGFVQDNPKYQSQ